MSMSSSQTPGHRDPISTCCTSASKPDIELELASNFSDKTSKVDAHLESYCLLNVCRRTEPRASGTWRLGFGLLHEPSKAAYSARLDGFVCVVVVVVVA